MKFGSDIKLQHNCTINIGYKLFFIKVSIFRNYAYLFLLAKKNYFASPFNVLAFEFDKNARIEFYICGGEISRAI